MKKAPRIRVTLKKPRRAKSWVASTCFNRKNGRSFTSQFQAAVHSLHEYFEKEKEFGGPLIPVAQVRENKVQFGGKRETLRKILHDIGFVYKLRNGVRYVTEQPHIKLKRIQFLKAFKKNMDEGKKYVAWQDETWTFRNGTGKTRDWQDKDIRSCSIRTCATGSRYIVCNIGGKEGFVPGASLIVSTEKKPKDGDDYHGDMNAVMFEKWFLEKVLPNLKKPSMIIMDNAFYHSRQLTRQPTTNMCKPDLEAWLTDHNILYEKDATKKELLAICKVHKRDVRYVVDDVVVKTTNHEILRLPPYHAFYNPIEMVWSDMKRYFDKHVGRDHDFSEKMMMTIWSEALERVTAERWTKYCDHCEKLILKDYYNEVADGPSPSSPLALTDNEPAMSDDNDEIEVKKTTVRRALFQDVPDETNSGGCNEEYHSPAKVSRMDDEAEGSFKHHDRDLDNPVISVAVTELLRKLEDSMVPCSSGLQIRVRDLKTLLPLKWINDQIVNAYFEMICRRGSPSIYACDTHFFPQLLGNNYANVRQWTKDVNIFDKKIMMIPIHLDNHWRLVAANFTRKIISYYDSMGGTNKVCLNTISQYLEQEHADKLSRPWDRANWQALTVANIPCQDNFSDCGVFMCTYAEHLFRNAPFNFTAQEMIVIRRTMMEEIGARELYHPRPTTTSTGPMIQGVAVQRTINKQLEISSNDGKASSPLKKHREITTNIGGIFLFESANFHQGDARCDKLLNHAPII